MSGTPKRGQRAVEKIFTLTLKFRFVLFNASLHFVLREEIQKRTGYILIQQEVLVVAEQIYRETINIKSRICLGSINRSYITVLMRPFHVSFFVFFSSLHWFSIVPAFHRFIVSSVVWSVGQCGYQRNINNVVNGMFLAPPFDHGNLSEITILLQ